MPLSAGDKLGPYDIIAPIGAGGMGEVYRARDPRLNRDVAIKVSAAQFSERFEREAKAIAALNHSNICQVYDVGPNYLVMEYIEGESPKGPMSLDEALRIARQIADALEAAHERGITHRDLKPGNIMIKPDGTVKVLDFGLAKVGRAPGSSSENSPTLTIGMTEAGMILGTAAYMAPEQARGKESVDKRADIWAFGVVLYELLTGKRPFQGEDVGEILASVIKEQPSLDEVPQQVRPLLRQCLEKDPKKRLRDIGDMELLLSVEAPVPRPSTPRHRSWLPWCIAAFLLLALMPANVIHFRETPPEARAVNSTLLPPDGAEFDFNNPFALPALSPDGTRIVYGAKAKEGKAQLYVRRLDSPTAQPLPGTEDAAFPFWSPDSRWVAFGQDNKLKKIDVQGGPPVAVTDLTGPLRGGSWSPAGVILFGVNFPSGILRVAAAGGTAFPATKMEQGKESGRHMYPWFLPDGRHFLYTSRQNGDIPVRVGSLDEPGKPGKVVAQAHSNAVYSQGHLLYLRENTLMAHLFDPDRLETTGEAVPLAEGIPTFPQPSRGAGFTVSAGVLLVYLSGATGAESRLVWKDRQGKTLGNLGETTSSIVSIALSPDGKRLAASIQDRSRDLWIYDTARGIPTRFTFDPASDQAPVWSPDGSTIYFNSDRRGQNDLFHKASSGAGAEELLLGDSANKLPNSVSPDGKLLLYQRGGQRGPDLWVLPLTPAPAAAKPEPRVFVQTGFRNAQGQFSPDGQWVAYASDESGQREVYAAPFPGPGGKRQISSGGGAYPRWRRDGKELFYMSSMGDMMAAEVASRNGTLEVGRVQKLFDGIVTGRGLTYDVSADGQKFLVVDDAAAAAPPLTLLENWTASLRK